MNNSKKQPLLLTVTNSNNFNHNKLTKIFSPRQTNIFYTVIALCQLHEKLIMEPITYTELMKLANIKGITKKSFKEMVELIKQSTSITEEIEGTEITYNIFSAFAINAENETISAKIAEDYRSCFCDLVSEYTKFFLEEHNSLSSNACKLLYRLLKQWKYIGKYMITIEEFETLFVDTEAIEESELSEKRRNYKRYYIDNNIKVLNEKKYFKNLKCETIKKNDKTHAIVGYEFTFIPEKKVIDVNTHQPISEDAIYKTLGNQNLMSSEYEQLCKLFNKTIVDGVIDRIIKKPYMGCLKYETIKKWCEEAKKSTTTGKPEGDYLKRKYDIDDLLKRATVN